MNSTPLDYEEVKQKLREANACTHADTTTCKRMTQNGSWQILKQCKHCGSRVGNFIAAKHLQGVTRDDLPLWDSALEQNTKEHLASMTVEAWNSEKLRQIEVKLVEYDKYLESSEWHEKRLLALKRDEYKCQSCLTRKAVEVHHLTYQRVFNEPLFDLVAVCNQCHRGLHDEGRTTLRRVFDMMLSRNNPYSE
jgi:hypothetical protein